jgi:DNA-binding transcriptional LysR family regulator
MISEEGSSELIQQIKNNRLDVAFILQKEDFKEEELTVFELMEARFMAIVNKKHPLASRSSLNLEDFRNQRLIISSDRFNLQRSLVSRMEQIGIPYKIATLCNQIETCFVLADQGFGISFCTESTIGHYDCSNVVYLPVEGFEKRSIYLIYKKDPEYYPVLKKFIEFIQAGTRESEPV